MFKSKEQKMKEEVVAEAKEALCANMEKIIDGLAQDPQLLYLGIQNIQLHLNLAISEAQFERRAGPLTPAKEIPEFASHVDSIYETKPEETKNDQYIRTELRAIGEAIDKVHAKVRQFATTDTENVRTDVLNGSLEAFARLVASLPRFYSHNQAAKSDGPRQDH